MILTLAGIVMIVGVLMYALSANGKLVEIGRILFGVGLLVVLLNTGAMVDLFNRR